MQHISVLMDYSFGSDKNGKAAAVPAADQGI